MTTEQTAVAASAADQTAAAASTAQGQQPANGPAQVATQMPVSAPATAQAQAPATTQEPTTPEKGHFGEAITYNKTDDPNVDLALAFIGKHGLGPDHPAVKSATQGDFGPIKAVLAEAGIPGWEAHVALAEKGYVDYQAREAEKTAAIQQIVVQAAGDEQSWADTMAWASQNAEPHEKDAVNSALAQGGVVAEAMAQFLVNSYRNATGTSYAPKESAVKQDAGRGATNPNAGPLSAAEYGRAVADLRRTRGVNFEQTPEYRQLQARRQAYRG